MDRRCRRYPGTRLAIFLRRLGADALDVAHHGEAERVRIDAVVARIVEIGLVTTLVCECRNLQQRAVGDQPLLVEPVDDVVMDEGGAALVHQLGLLLRIKILRDVAHDAHQLALPRFEPRRALLEEIEQVLLGQTQLACESRRACSPRRRRSSFFAPRTAGGAPEIVVIAARSAGGALPRACARPRG